MINIVGVRFRKGGKVYYFRPEKLELSLGDGVIVETARGIEYGTIALAEREIDEKQLPSPCKSIIRVATEKDKSIVRENQRKQKDAFAICTDKIAKHGLSMKLIDVEYTFDQAKVIFYFSAEKRVDFRELVKDLASVFRTRIELRQIGVRDVAKMVGGYSICGRELCCHSVLGEYQPVSIKMAKQQNLFLNPGKISGACGRLMCCLKYEAEDYDGKPAFCEKCGCKAEDEDLEEYKELE